MFVTVIPQYCFSLASTVNVLSSIAISRKDSAALLYLATMGLSLSLQSIWFVKKREYEPSRIFTLLRSCLNSLRGAKKRSLIASTASTAAMLPTVARNVEKKSRRTECVLTASVIRFNASISST